MHLQLVGRYGFQKIADRELYFEILACGVVWCGGEEGEEGEVVMSCDKMLL